MTSRLLFDLLVALLAAKKLAEWWWERSPEGPVPSEPADEADERHETAREATVRASREPLSTSVVLSYLDEVFRHELGPAASPRFIEVDYFTSQRWYYVQMEMLGRTWCFKLEHPHPYEHPEAWVDRTVLPQARLIRKQLLTVTPMFATAGGAG